MTSVVTRTITGATRKNLSLRVIKKKGLLIGFASFKALTKLRTTQSAVDYATAPLTPIENNDQSRKILELNAQDARPRLT